MSINISVVGIRDLDGQFARMLAVKKACEEAKIAYPPGCIEYFKNVCRCHPGEDVNTLRRDAESVQLSKDIIKMDSIDDCDTWTIDLSKLPPDVKAVRFIASY